MKTNNSASKTLKVENDPRLFIAILTIVVLGMVAVSVRENPAIKRPGVLIPLAILVIIHILLHWFLGIITKNARWIPWYIILQGAIAFGISYLAGGIAMIFALFMGLVGEAIGLLRLTRWGFLAVAYYLILAISNFLLITDLRTLEGWLLGAIPLLLFVIIYVNLYMRQNEARDQAETLLRELEIANQQLSEYAAQVEDLTITAERQRLARDLHDTLSQGLAGLILQLEAVDAHLKNDRTTRATEILEQSMEHARETLAAARRTISDLRENTREISDLNGAIQEEVKHFEDATGIGCQLNLQVKDGFSSEIREFIMRIVAEALTNIARHASARQVSINLFQQDNSLKIEIKDDGKGFDPASVGSGHYGLIGMRERTRLVGGSMDIESSAEFGTVLKFVIPIENTHE